MLIRFIVSNFLSFKEETEFNMLAGSLRTHQHHVYSVGKVNALKASAIYGANGAGKSNLIQAIDFLKTAVIEGKINHAIENNKFKLDKTYKEKPSTFEAEFSIGKKIYTYGVSINHTTIEEEWLYETGTSANGKLIFERKKSKNNKIKIDFADKYKETPKQKLLIELLEDNILKHDELLLSKTDFLKIKEIDKIKDWFENGLIIIYPQSKFAGLAPMFYASEGFADFTNTFFDKMDTGVSELGLKNIDFEKYFADDEIKEEVRQNLSNDKFYIFEDVIVTKENNKNVVKKVVSFHKDNLDKKVEFEIDEESDGTQRLLDFIPAFFKISSQDVTFIVDEIDQSIHPSLLFSLVEKIMNDKNTKGQFIFTTHESNLLDFDIFRQDEIWFAEKDRKIGSTKLYSLNEYKPRYDLDIRKGYLKGRFGAVPFLADLETLNWANHGI